MIPAASANSAGAGDPLALAAWLAHAPMPAALIDADFRIVAASPALAALCGPNLPGRALGTLVHPDDLLREIPAWQAIAIGSGGQARTTRLLAADGSARTVAISLGRIDAPTGPAYLLTAWPTAAIPADVASHPDHAQRDLGLIAALCSHDLRQHTRLAVSFVEVAIARDPGNAVTRPHLDRSRDEAAALGRKLAALTARLRLCEPVAAQPTDANAALTAALGDRAVQLATATVIAGTLPRVQAHAPDLVLVLGELIANAAEHRAGPHVRIAIDAFPTPNDPERCTFAVSDDGPGIPAVAHEQVFRPFVTLNAVDSGESHRGMGLTRVRAVVERQGGRIWIDPAHRPGTRVLFTWATA